MTTKTHKDYKTTFCSLYDGDMGGSMISLLKRYGMRMLSSDGGNIGQCEIVVFNGGADIGTVIYNEKPIQAGIPLYPSMRDQHEIDIFSTIKFAPILKVGICRGAQILNCLNGGTLWQHVNNHTVDHLMTVVETQEKMKITSTHHQMMRPGPNAQIIGVSDQATSKYSQNDTWHSTRKIQVSDEYPDDHEDTEIVYYPETHSLCIQGHPEYVPGSIFADFCIELIDKYLMEIRQSADL